MSESSLSNASGHQLGTQSPSGNGKVEEFSPSNTANFTSAAMATSSNTNAMEEDSEIEAIKRRLRQAEEDAARLTQMQAQVVSEIHSSGAEDFVNSAESDARSVYVGNVDFGATPEELQAHFQTCGTINRITILTDKWTGHPKGYAYVEFADPAHVANAMALNESIFRNRLLKVTTKRTNVPGFMMRGRGGGYRGGRPPRSRGHRGAGRSRRGHYAPY